MHLHSDRSLAKGGRGDGKGIRAKVEGGHPSPPHSRGAFRVTVGAQPRSVPSIKCPIWWVVLGLGRWDRGAQENGRDDRDFGPKAPSARGPQAGRRRPNASGPQAEIRRPA